MKIGRNDLCPCGSGKKYKRCCMDKPSQQFAQIQDEIEQTLAMNPNLNLEELNAVAQYKMAQVNDLPNDDFFGVSPSQMHNWLYAQFNELMAVSITTPKDLSMSPVMRYLEIIVNEAMDNGGSFKATAKGNLPTKLVKQASEVLAQFAVYKDAILTQFYEYQGSNEDKFDALHYTRVLAEIAGIIYHKGGRFHLKKTAQKQMQNQGIGAFFLPMLEAAVREYNWGYLDGWEETVDLRLFWLFMLWRIKGHRSFHRLIEEVITAFPSLLEQLEPDKYYSSKQKLSLMIESRFINRFLQYWGFVTFVPVCATGERRKSTELNIQPLLNETFEFTI